MLLESLLSNPNLNARQTNQGSSSVPVERLAALPLTGIIPTDTVPIPPDKLAQLGDKLTILSVAPLLGEVIKRAHEGRSVGAMFNE